ncbi:hypothetical protein C8P63_10618 [Melghirimyces profundicolus]|uniref:Uncharacterized protein n=1 Tax=Melghirimyces profundicolus TaxID=1242148 RepID=A0A2T6C0C4_9BACL|nr:hypothetical protein C8P63_10618 [Melghirimyces profundicolus]
MLRCPQCGSRRLLHAYDERYYCCSCHWHTIPSPVRIVYTYYPDRVERWIEWEKG